MKVNLKLARIGMNMQEATIVKWHKQAGEEFRKGEVLYEIETEKVTQEVEAQGDGHVVLGLPARQPVAVELLFVADQIADLAVARAMGAGEQPVGLRRRHELLAVVAKRLGQQPLVAPAAA